MINVSDERSIKQASRSLCATHRGNRWRNSLHAIERKNSGKLWNMLHRLSIWHLWSLKTETVPA